MSGGVASAALRTASRAHRAGSRAHRGRRSVRVAASIFGVGAPEALVIGVVALLVFGPKGLADIAKQLGQTLRAFQPTIRELQEVSREFKETLEDEIGLDEIRNPPPVTPKPAKSAAAEPAATEANAAEAEETSAGEEVTEEMKRKAAEAAWGVAEPPAQADAADAVDEASAEAPAEVKPMPAELSAEDGEKKTEA